MDYLFGMEVVIIIVDLISNPNPKRKEAMSQQYKNILDSLNAMGLYAKHVKSTLEFSGLEDKPRRQIALILESMYEESCRQERAFKQALAH